MKQKKLAYREYPKADGERGGCKVGWRYYADRKAAEACAAAAKHNARIQAGLGFDFGYQCPGDIQKAREGSDHPGMWMVCIP